MRPITYTKAKKDSDALDLIASHHDAAFLAGGTTLIDLMKLGTMAPSTLVDINRLPEGEIKDTGHGILIGALVRNSDLAYNKLVMERYPLLSQAILSGASAQLRNMATVGGNLMQRTRCPYFRDTTMPCNKREPGSGCPAIDGINRGHAIFGGSKHCVAVHPSDMCVALLALDAVIHTRGHGNERKIPISEFYLVPDKHPERETVLQHGELILAVEIPRSPLAAHSHYLKVRDRASFSFALVSVAAGLDLDGEEKVRQVRIAMGGVATKPWRVDKAEKVLLGNKIDDSRIAQAAAAAIEGAQPLKYNKFKVELARRSVIRALETAWKGSKA